MWYADEIVNTRDARDCQWIDFVQNDVLSDKSTVWLLGATGTVSPSSKQRHCTTKHHFVQIPIHSQLWRYRYHPSCSQSRPLSPHAITIYLINTHFWFGTPAKTNTYSTPLEGGVGGGASAQQHWYIHAIPHIFVLLALFFQRNAQFTVDHLRQTCCVNILYIFLSDVHVFPWDKKSEGLDEIRIEQLPWSVQCTLACVNGANQLKSTKQTYVILGHFVCQCWNKHVRSMCTNKDKGESVFFLIFHRSVLKTVCCTCHISTKSCET